MSFFLGNLKDFFRLSVLCYLSSAKDIPLTGKLIRPVDVKGGIGFQPARMYIRSMQLRQNMPGTEMAFSREEESSVPTY